MLQPLRFVFLPLLLLLWSFCVSCIENTDAEREESDTDCTREYRLTNSDCFYQ